MATNLVTGGAGFLGSHIVRSALDLPEFQKDRWVVLDDLSGGFRENVPSDERVEFVEGSINDVDLVEHLFRTHQFRFVYHLAAYAAEGLSHYIRRFNYTNNVVGSMTLVNAAIRHDAECFVFTSSIAVYGAAQTPMHEDTTPCPEDPYGIAKYAVELDLQAARDLFGLKSIIFRPHNVYGPHQNIGDRYRNVIGIFMNELLHGRPMPVFGDGEQQRAFTYVEDIAPLMARAPLVAASYDKTFNIGSDQAYTVNQLAQQTAAALDVPAQVRHLPQRHEVRHAMADHGRLKSVFGAQAETSLDEGLRRMAAWARAVGPRAATEFTAIELRRGLPEVWASPEKK